MIKKITIEAISIKPNKKDGSPYMWNDKKTNTMKPRTMVSLKEGDNWYMGWSYKSGSAAETLKVGQTVEVLLEESTKINPDGTSVVFKSWKFPKPEDKANQEIAELKAKLASISQTPNCLPAVDGSVPLNKVPF